MSQTIALFGEAEKGEYRVAYFCDSLPDLVDNLGNPPTDSKGLHYAVQTLLFQRHLIFFRVKEEGYSTQDYLQGLRFLENRQLIPQLSAIYMPGVGDSEVIQTGANLCHLYKGILIVNEADLYDYLTAVDIAK